MPSPWAPFTYLIGWKEHDKWYYGVRYARNCHPNDLWDKYFTSSSYVQKFREEHGEPDVIEVRRTFLSQTDAVKWEHKVLRRLKVVKNVKWLNQGNWGDAISGHRPIGFKETEETKVKKRNALKGKSNSHKGVFLSEEHKQKISQSAKSGKTGKFVRTPQMNAAQSIKIKGRKRTNEMKTNYKNAALQRPKKLCQFCQREIAINIFNKFHGENCRENKNVISL